MTKHPKISVIVAVYKAEQYIEKCAHTLFGQTFQSIEYIFIDDASPDKSMEILCDVLEKYPNRKHQVKIIRHEENKGIGASRQEGIDLALSDNSEYIIHCDPDDWIEQDMYEILYNHAIDNNADVVFCDFSKDTDCSSEVFLQRPSELHSNAVLGNIVGSKRPKLMGSLWNKLISSKCYKEVKIPIGVNFCEDVLACIQILKKERRIHYVPYVGYHYRVDNASSVTHISQENHFKGNKKMMEILEHTPDLKHEIKCAHGEFILMHAFIASNYSSKEFLLNYKGYLKYIGYYTNFHANIIKGFILHLILYLSCIGLYAPIKNTFMLTNRIRSSVRNKIQGIKPTLQINQK